MKYITEMDNKEITVVQSNELIEAAYALTVDEMRLILLASSKIDSRKSEVGKITIFAREFAEKFGLPKKHIYDNLKKSVSQIMRKPIVFFENSERIERAWFIENRYQVNPGDGTYVTIQFSPLIEPYLYELKDKFTSINFEHAAKLNSPFSFRLYQWLIKVKNLKSNKNNDVISVVLDIIWMKERSGNANSYPQWRDYKDRVITPAVEQINSKTDISIIWEPLKKGRAIHAIKFSYVVEAATFAKPIRPRLYRRPKVIKGSHEEGEWMRKNYKLLNDYQNDLKAYDPKAKMTIMDLRKMAEYATIFDNETEKKLKKEITERANQTQG